MRFFFRLSAPMCTSLKKPYHIITLWFGEVVKEHANCTIFPIFSPPCKSPHWSIWFLNFFAERRFFKVHTIMNVGNLMLLHDSISHLDVNYMIFESSKWCLLLSMLYDWLDEPVHLISHPSPLIKSSVQSSFLESCSMIK